MVFSGGFLRKGGVLLRRHGLDQLVGRIAVLLELFEVAHVLPCTVLLGKSVANHRITSSTLYKTDSGTVKPSAFALFRLTMS